VVERSDTTGMLLPITLHPEGVPATFLVRPARLKFGLLKKEYEIVPMISLDLKDQQRPCIGSPPPNQMRKFILGHILIRQRQFEADAR
jgi:hypothetical protein